MNRAGVLGPVVSKLSIAFCSIGECLTSFYFRLQGVTDPSSSHFSAYEQKHQNEVKVDSFILCIFVNPDFDAIACWNLERFILKSLIQF